MISTHPEAAFSRIARESHTAMDCLITRRKNPWDAVKTPNTKHQAPNTKLQTPNSKHQAPNTKLQTPSSRETPNIKSAKVARPFGAHRFFPISSGTCGSLVGKSEARNPKPEGIPKPEIRIAACWHGR
jgi:hypothetical protein